MGTYRQWDSNARWYDKNMGEQGDKLNKRIIKPIVLEMIGNISGKVILDSGCGSGYLAREFSQKAKKVIGTDFSSNFIKLCKKKYSKIVNLEFIQHDVVRKMPFNNNSFDIVLTKMVLQYIQQINAFAGESWRVLRIGGILFVIVDHPFNAQFYFAQQIAGKPNSKYPNLHNYFDKREQTKLSLWGKVKLTWYPKTISDYILPFIEVGFVLSDMREMPEEKNGIKIPRILALKFIKNH